MTAPEIWAQMEQDVDAVVVGVGSGGTLTGIGRFMKAHSPKTQMILADPVGSILRHYVETGELIEAGSWTIEGIGEDFIPVNAQMDLVSKAYSISDRDSTFTLRDLLKSEGILAGSSSGTLLAAALRYCREQTSPKRVVSLVCDTGSKYLTKAFNDFWVSAQGFTERDLHGDLRDLITKRYSEGGVITIGPDDTLLTAYNRMRSSDISQLRKAGRNPRRERHPDRRRGRGRAPGAEIQDPGAGRHDPQGQDLAGQPADRLPAACLRPRRSGRRP